MECAAKKPCPNLVRDLANGRHRALHGAPGRQKFTPDSNILDVFERSSARFCGEHRRALSHDLDYPESSCAKDVRGDIDGACGEAARTRPAGIEFFFVDHRARCSARPATCVDARRASDIARIVEARRHTRRIVAMTSIRIVRGATVRASFARRRVEAHAHRSCDADPRRDVARRARRATDHSRLSRATIDARLATC